MDIGIITNEVCGAFTLASQDGSEENGWLHTSLQSASGNNQIRQNLVSGGWSGVQGQSYQFGGREGPYLWWCCIFLENTQWVMEHSGGDVVTLIQIQ